MGEIKSLERILERYPYLNKRHDGFPSVGNRKIGNYSDPIQKIVDGFSLYDSLIATRFFNSMKEYNFTSGDPLSFKAFKPVKKAMHEYIENGSTFRYPYSEGDDRIREILVKYLVQEGIINTEPYDYKDINEAGLSRYNLTFTVATSHAFQLIMDIITREHDVIIVPGPNYGLFAMRPERISADVVILPLKEEDNYLPNPEELDKLIKKTNQELANKYRESSYIPKVVGFLNANPNNPTGKVMGISEYERLKKIGEVCKNNGTFVIDDLVYRDISYNEKEKALPIATIPGMFRNTISLFGLSKSYGMASLRSGFVVADEIIIREVVNKIFQEMDAVPAIIGEALAGAFNNTIYRNKEYQKYFSKLREEYIKRYQVFKSLIMGIDSIEPKYRDTVLNLLREHTTNNDYYPLLDNGINGVNIMKNLEPESGFFLLLNFNELKGMHYQDMVINNEFDLLKYLYSTIKLRYILGSGCLWPNKDDLIGRFTYAKSYEDLIDVSKLMDQSIKKLTK
jgi:aspartate aminotransferase